MRADNSRGQGAIASPRKYGGTTGGPDRLSCSGCRCVSLMHPAPVNTSPYSQNGLSGTVSRYIQCHMRSPSSAHDGILRRSRRGRSPAGVIQQHCAACVSANLSAHSPCTFRVGNLWPVISTCVCFRHVFLPTISAIGADWSRSVWLTNHRRSPYRNVSICMLCPGFLNSVAV